MDLEYNTIYEMYISGKYKFKAIKSMNGIIYTLISTNKKRTSVIMDRLSEELNKALPFDLVTFKLDGKVVCSKSVQEVFDSESDPTTGMNIIAEETLWLNRVDKDEVNSIRDTLNEEIRRRKNGKGNNQW